MIDETDHEIKNIFLDVIYYCGDLQGAYNRVDKERNSTIVKFIYRETDNKSDNFKGRQLMAAITINGTPVIVQRYFVAFILMLQESRLKLKEMIMSEIFISGVIRAKEQLDLLKK